MAAQHNSNLLAYLKLERPYWGNHFWAEWYCVDKVDLDAEMIRKYVVYTREERAN